jgi:hypothetical protein
MAETLEKLTARSKFCPIGSLTMKKKRPRLPNLENLTLAEERPVGQFAEAMRGCSEQFRRTLSRLGENDLMLVLYTAIASPPSETRPGLVKAGGRKWQVQVQVP